VEVSVVDPVAAGVTTVAVAGVEDVGDVTTFGTVGVAVDPSGP
jgi:hypothetical protein